MSTTPYFNDLPWDLWIVIATQGARGNWDLIIYLNSDFQLEQLESNLDLNHANVLFGPNYSVLFNYL